MNPSTDADSRTDTILKKLHNFLRGCVISRGKEEEEKRRGWVIFLKNSVKNTKIYGLDIFFEDVAWGGGKRLSTKYG